MKILVTGAAGFIGFHLAKKLVALGYEVMGLDSINDYYDVNLKYDRLAEAGIHRESINWNLLVPSQLHPNYQFVQMNLKDTKELNQLFEQQQFAVVINLAAQAGVRYSLSNPMAYVESNVTGFLNILECARAFKIGHLIYASSSSVYGITDDVPFSEEHNTDKPVSLYAATKKSNELMAYTYSHLYGIPVTGLRFFTVYGPWGRPEMSPILFAKAIASDQPIKVFNEGNLSRDFTYVDDIVAGVCKVLALPAPEKANAASQHPLPPYRIFNIGNNAPVKLMYFIELMEKALGKEAKKEMLPMQQGDVYETYANIEALHKWAGYTPSTNIETGVAKFVEWFNQYYLNRDKA
jgi:UDP-glucuronate 4-epimerase